MMDLLKRAPSISLVECLGQAFPTEQARRDHFLKLLAEKLKAPAFSTKLRFGIA